MSNTQSPGEFGIKHGRVNDVLTNRARDGVTPESREVSAAEFVRDLLAADDGPHGVAVTEALPHGDDVRDEAVLHEAPHVVSSPPHPRLDLVRYDESAVLSDHPEHVRR